MGSLAILVLSGPYTYQNTVTAVNLIRAARAKGHEIKGLYFFVDGVLNVSKDIRAEEGVFDVRDAIQSLIDASVPVFVCSACCEYRGITQENLIPGVEIAGMALFGEIYEKSDRVIVFGM